MYVRLWSFFECRRTNVAIYLETIKIHAVVILDGLQESEGASGMLVIWFKFVLADSIRPNFIGLPIKQRYTFIQQLVKPFEAIFN